MKIVEVNTYTFDELKPDIQEEVIDRMRYDGPGDWWYEDVLEEFQRKAPAWLEFKHAEWDEMFNVDWEDNVDVGLYIKETWPKICLTMNPFSIGIELSENGLCDPDGYIDDSYISEMYEEAGYSEEKSNEIAKKLAPKLQRIMDSMADDIEILKRNLGDELEAAWDYYTSDEAIKEDIEARELTFLEDGTIWRD